MRIIPPNQFMTMPWANGGGITHEIARAQDAGALLWRLSIAEVAEDGAFSRFAGLARVLTVTLGAGMVLDTPEDQLQALPDQPLFFSGDTPVMARLIDGPLTDFNVIYDPLRIEARVRVATEAEVLASGDVVAVLCLTGRVSVNSATLPIGAVGLGDQITVRLSGGARALIAELDHRGTKTQ